MTDRILDTDPKHVGALEVRAKAGWAVKDLALTIALAEKLILLNPFEPGYYSLKGAALQAMARYSEAILAYRRGIELGGERHAESSAMFLQQCEESVLSELLTQDATFREAYKLDPRAACLSRGLTLTARSTESRIAPLTRPS